ncbi:FtsH protease activity modulator HflK [Murimonas intestini]|uniref:Protein HflK n=1 Tax=Murimonas intestini TaxID=1337051 RepID=A0AB73T2R0_9FIRM|nr:FtsH protease activity modulator HflK [Murimonas intestini]MCR1841792.1 FtsH protease activity modulator HflK [Murimonas intestini]MCR1865609.1 FtsH protease activity modulator HflK [Murimonas intestini]MCR1883810.1 FtsH protease activity modulator HflK [Murimonas intestini]
MKIPNGQDFFKRKTQFNTGSDSTYHSGGSSGRSGGRIKRTVIIVIAAVVFVFLGMGAFYQIQEQEQAVLITFGKPKAVTETGLHFKLPVIQQVKKVNTTIQGFPIGYDPATNEPLDSESVMITNDYNFIDVDFFVEYRISDPVQYLYASKQPEDILKNIAQGSIRTVIGSYKVDDVLTTGKSEIQAKIKEMILTKMEEQDVGIQLVNITIQDSEPPTVEVMQAFKAVETAKQGKETSLNNANKYRNEKLPEAEATADQIIKNAEAKKQTRINEAEAQVSRFDSMYAEYEKNPVVTKQRMFYEAMEEVLPGMKIIIDNGDGVQKVLPLDSFTGDSSAESQTGTQTPKTADPQKPAAEKAAPAGTEANSSSGEGSPSEDAAPEQETEAGN